MGDPLEPKPPGASDQDLVPGSQVSEYRIESTIGKGGFGTVYRAVHPVIGKLVAIKVLGRRHAADPDIVSRFVAEARAVNQIRHRNIIDIFAFNQLDDGRHYYVMEYLEGEPLEHIIRRDGAMALADALPLLRQLAFALDAAHAKGIAHRDVKPDNVFVTHDGNGEPLPKLLDFGIAKLLAPDGEVPHRTQSGVAIGTPHYMSPEQCRGREVDHRTDIYSFGVLAYRLLTGVLPFEDGDYIELLRKQMEDEPVRPSTRDPRLPTAVDDAIAWMMRKLPDARPRRVIDGVTALDPSAIEKPQRTRPARPSRIPVASATSATVPHVFDPLAASSLAPTLPEPTRARRRDRGWAAIAALAIACGGVAIALSLHASASASDDRAAPAPAAPLAPEPVAPQPDVVRDASGDPVVPADAPPPAEPLRHPPPKVEKTLAHRPPTVRAGSAAEPTPASRGDIIHIDDSAFEPNKK